MEWVFEEVVVDLGRRNEEREKKILTIRDVTKKSADGQFTERGEFVKSGQLGHRR